MSRIFCLAAALAICFIPSAKSESILLCGADTVFVVDTATAAKGKIEKTWIWNAKQCDQLPEAMRPHLRHNRRLQAGGRRGQSLNLLLFRAAAPWSNDRPGKSSGMPRCPMLIRWNSCPVPASWWRVR